MQNKDLRRFNIGLNKDDNPTELQPGEYTDALNMRVASSTEQQGIGILESIQGEVEQIINAVTQYYGQAIGGQFIYEGYEQVVIGTQTWMLKNWDIKLPGSKVYNNDEANRTLFGGLYKYSQLFQTGFVPAGWHVPTLAEINTLMNFLGGPVMTKRHLKEAGTSRWESPNALADNLSSFTGIGGGKYNGSFIDLMNEGAFWVIDQAQFFITAITISSSQIDLSWENDNLDGYTGIKIERSTDGINFVQVALIAGNATSYQNTGLNVLTEYWFRIRGVIGITNYAYSNIATAWTWFVAAGVWDLYFDFLWTGVIINDYLVSDLPDHRRIEIVGRDFVTSYIPETTAATFKLQADADLILNDATDHLWFDLAGVQRNTTLAEMIKDNYRTFIKYRNASPFNVVAIAVLKSTVILTPALIDAASHDFELWLFWTQVWNDFGFLKDNRIMDIGKAVELGTGVLIPALAPTAPSLLTATTYSSTRIDLAWTNPAENMSGNKIYISTDNVNFSLNATIPADTNYAITGLLPNTTYYFKVTIFRGVEESSDSNVDNTITLLAPPSDIVLTLISGGVKIDWIDNSGGLDEIEIWGQSDGAAYALITTLPAGSVTYNNIVYPADLRYYKLRGKNGIDYSDYTAPLSIAMLSGEMIIQNQWYTVGYWTNLGANWSCVGNTLVSDGSTNKHVWKQLFWVSGQTYRIRTTCARIGGSAAIWYDGTHGAAGGPINGSYDYLYTPSGPTGQGLWFATYGTPPWSGTISALSIKRVLMP